MTRQIKFRGKRTDNGEWVYGYYAEITLRNAFNMIVIKHIIIDCQKEGLYEEEVIGNSVGQFTGLHDKNGKEIYEGDIIESPCNIRHQILFSEERGCLCQYGVEFISWMDGYYEGGAITQSYINEFGKVVIGNIHDNKDLIINK